MKKLLIIILTVMVVFSACTGSNTIPSTTGDSTDDTSALLDDITNSTSEESAVSTEEPVASEENLTTVTENTEDIKQLEPAENNISSPKVINWSKDLDTYTDRLYGIANNGEIYVAVGAIGTVKISTYCSSWNGSVSGTPNNLNDVIWTGKEFVAVGDKGTIISSANGTEWMTISTETENDFNSIAKGPDNYVIVGNKETIMVSEDLSSWLVVHSSILDGRGSKQLWKVIWGDNQYVAVGNTILTSSDGIKWVKRADKGILMHDIVWTGEYYVSTHWGYPSISKDAVTWTDKDFDCAIVGFINLSYVAWDGKKIIGLGELGGMVVSEDYENWNYSRFNSDMCCDGLFWSGKEFLALYHWLGEMDGMVNKSTDGKNWTYSFTGTPDDFSDIVYNGKTHLITSDHYAEPIMSSTDGINWINHRTDIPKYGFANIGLRSIIWTGTQFIAVGYNGRIITSPDGEKWTEREKGAYNILFCVVWNGNQAIAAGGFNGTIILTSDDGISWTLRSEKSKASGFYSIIWADNFYIATGWRRDGTSVSERYGVMLTSTDGVNWSDIKIESNIPTQKIAWNGTIFIAVGSEGTILSSQDGKEWTEQDSNVQSSLHDIVWNGSEFVTVGGDGTILSSSDGINWLYEGDVAFGNLRSIIWTGKEYIIVGDKGTILHGIPCY